MPCDEQRRAAALLDRPRHRVEVAHAVVDDRDGLHRGPAPQDLGGGRKRALPGSHSGGGELRLSPSFDVVVVDLRQVPGAVSCTSSPLRVA